MDYELPELEPRKLEEAVPYARQIFGDAFIELKAMEEGRFRVVFRSTYFTLREDQNEPSKSQWSTLKKKMKRHNRQVFIFKGRDEVDCDEFFPVKPNFRCYTLDFGFFAY